MNRYATTVSIPTGFRPFIEALREVGYPSNISFESDTIDLELDAEDEYELAVTVKNLERNLNTMGLQYEGFEIERPVLIDDSI